MSRTMSRDFTPRLRQILIVDGAVAGQYSLVEIVASEGGFAIDTVASASACAARLGGSAPPDAIMVAADLIDGDGADLCFRLRQRGLNIPILLVAENASEAQVVRGLDLGANDVIVAPLRPAEALARLRAQIRAYETSEDAILAIGPFQFRPARRQLQHSVTGARIRLTEKEAAVLKFLYRAEGPVPRTTLLHEVWGYNAGATTHTVETHIYRLRRKIEPDSNRIGLLVNEDGGYRLCLEQSRPRAKTWQPVPMLATGELSHLNHVANRMMLA